METQNNIKIKNHFTKRVGISFSTTIVLTVDESEPWMTALLENYKQFGLDRTGNVVW